MPRKILAFFGIILFVIFLIGITHFFTHILQIKNITCYVDDKNCPVELNQQLEVIKEESFLFSVLETKIQQLNLDLYQLNSITKRWPNTVILNFSKKPNSYLIKTNQQDSLLLVSKNGIAQPTSSVENLPLIEVNNWSDLIKDNQISTDLHQLNISLVQSLAAQNISYKIIRINNPQEIEIILQENLVALAQKEDLENQIIKLSIVLEKLDLKAIDLQINQIDLRFKFPILKNSNEK